MAASADVIDKAVKVRAVAIDGPAAAAQAVDGSGDALGLGPGFDLSARLGRVCLK